MTIFIADPAPVSGLKFRHFQGETDFAGLAAVLTASETADKMDRQISADDLAIGYQHLSNCDPYADLIIAQVDDRMVGYTRGWWENRGTLQRLYIHNGFLIPEWRRHGIGRCMLIWMEQHLHEVASSHPAEIEKVYRVSVTQFQPGNIAMLEHGGYKPVRYFYLMVRPTLDDIPEFQLPEGLEIRPVKPEHYRLIWRLNDETCQDEWEYKQSTEDDYKDWLSHPNFQPDLWQVAWDTATDQVIGQVLTYIQHAENEQLNRKRGHTEGIGVSRSWRRRGVASALISRSLLAQKAVGMTESALVVDSENPSGATHLYETCGFQVVRRDTLYHKLMDA
jgi:mycothiol synthase